MRLKKLLCIACFTPLFVAEAGTVRLFSGETYTGKIAIDNTGITVTPEHGPTVKLDLARVFDAELADNHPAAAPASVSPGVVLTNGSFVAGAVTAFEEPAVKLGTAAQPIAVPTAAVASIVFAPTPRSAFDQPKSAKTGAILPNGDFFAGTFSGIKKNAVVINSVLFGPHPFTLKSQVAAVVLRESQPVAAGYEIGTKDGSRYQATDLRIDSDGFLLNDSVLGRIKIANADLATIHAGSARCQIVTNLTPSGSAGSERKEDPDTLVTALNAPVTYPVSAGLGVFSCSVALAKEADPAIRVVFAVYCDGRPVFRSPPVGSAMGPQNLRVNFGAAKQITLRVEPVTPGTKAVEGHWIEPVLVRP